MESVDANITRMAVTPTVAAGLTVLAASEQIGATSNVFQTGAGAAEALGSSTSSLEQILEAVVKVMDSISQVTVHCRVEYVHDMKFDTSDSQAHPLLKVSWGALSSLYKVNHSIRFLCNVMLTSLFS